MFTILRNCFPWSFGQHFSSFCSSDLITSSTLSQHQVASDMQTPCSGDAPRAIFSQSWPSSALDSRANWMSAMPFAKEEMRCNHANYQLTGARSHTDLTRRRSLDVQDVHATDLLANGRPGKIRNSPPRAWMQTTDQTILQYLSQLRMKARLNYRWHGQHLRQRSPYRTAFERFHFTQTRCRCYRGSFTRPPPL
jgi:hypothetical protein